jgi:tetratricopeptide (TPR) repeat protein
MAYEMGEIAVRENLFPDAFLRRGLAANTLVKYYLLKQQYTLAAEKIEEAITAYEKQENGFLDMASILAKQGMLYARMGNPAAKEIMYRAIGLYEEYGGKYSGTYFECLWTLIEYLEAEKDFREAIKYSEKTLDYARLVYEEGHNKIVRIKNKIAVLHEKTLLYV